MATYNLRNQIATTVVENGLFTATRSYDTAGRLTGISNGALDSTGYTLSPDGRRTGITRNGDTESYGYDNARQVTSGNYGGLSATQSWNYDPASNRQNATTNGVTTNYLANAVNEYTSISGGGFQPPNPTYDANGNATTWNVLPLGSSSLESSVFTWNIHNELTSVSNSSGDTATYAYDALGRRVKRVETIGGTTTTTWFFYNGWNVELEHNGTAHTRRHTWGLDLSGTLQGAGGVGGLVMVEHLDTGSGPEPYFPTYDGNGNITAWVDANGTVTASQRYDAFGNILSQTGIAPSNCAFSTKPKERVTGLYYYGYRYLDPVTGRWINRDPIEEAGGMNLYGFVKNLAVSVVDDLGESPFGSVEKPLPPYDIKVGETKSIFVGTGIHDTNCCFWPDSNMEPGRGIGNKEGWERWHVGYFGDNGIGTPSVREAFAKNIVDGLGLASTKVYGGVIDYDIKLRRDTKTKYTWVLKWKVKKTYKNPETGLDENSWEQSSPGAVKCQLFVPAKEEDTIEVGGEVFK